MGASFWIGLVVIPSIAVIVAGSAWLIVGARKAWHSIHDHLLYQPVKLRADPTPVEFAPWNQRAGTKVKPRPTYELEANRIRDALVKVPKMHTFAGFGWYIAVIRDFKEGGEN